MVTDDQQFEKAFETFRKERKRRVNALVMDNLEVFLELARLEGNLTALQALKKFKDGTPSTIKLVVTQP